MRWVEKQLFCRALSGERNRLGGLHFHIGRKDVGNYIGRAAALEQEFNGGESRLAVCNGNGVIGQCALVVIWPFR